MKCQLLRYTATIDVREFFTCRVLVLSILLMLISQLWSLAGLAQLNPADGEKLLEAIEESQSHISEQRLAYTRLFQVRFFQDSVDLNLIEDNLAESKQILNRAKGEMTSFSFAEASRDLAKGKSVISATDVMIHEDSSHPSPPFRQCTRKQFVVPVEHLPPLSGPELRALIVNEVDTTERLTSRIGLDVVWYPRTIADQSSACKEAHDDFYRQLGSASGVFPEARRRLRLLQYADANSILWRAYVAAEQAAIACEVK